jgi:hypothetical protein
MADKNFQAIETYKGYSICIEIYMKTDIMFLYNETKEILCHPSSRDKVKLLIDAWEYPSEFAKKFEDLLNE